MSTATVLQSFAPLVLRSEHDSSKFDFIPLTTAPFEILSTRLALPELSGIAVEGHEPFAEDLESIVVPKMSKTERELSFRLGDGESLRVKALSVAGQIPVERNNGIREAFRSITNWTSPAREPPVRDSVDNATSHLIDSVFTTVLGAESTLFGWSSVADRFEWRDLNGKGKGAASQGSNYSEAMLDDIEIFLSIGTALARLEMAVRLLTSSKPHSIRGPPTRTSHAIASSLSIYIAWIREEITSIRSLPSTSAPLHSPMSLAFFCCHLLPIGATLEALAATFLRPLEVPPPYARLSLSSHHLLSHLYDSLSSQLSDGPQATSNLLLQASRAWILDGALSDWARSWMQWIGMISSNDNEAMERAWSECGISVKRGRERNEYTLDLTRIPSFFPEAMAIELFESGKCLRVLRATTPNHPLCRSRASETSQTGLYWCERDAHTFQQNAQRRVLEMSEECRAWWVSAPRETAQQTSVTIGSLVDGHPVDLGPLLSLLDQTPGSTFASPPSSERSRLLSVLTSVLPIPLTATATILPSSHVNLDSLLSSSILTPLLAFSPLASSELVSLFFLDLSLQSHLSLLRSYFLLGSPTFAEKLKATLFAVGETERSRMNPFDKLRIGATLDKGAAEMSLGLRNALRESVVEERERELDSRVRSKTVRAEQRQAWIDGAETRLTFVMRDETEIDSKPMHNSLDDLCITYIPRTPLDLIITPRILAQYNTIFSHLLRLLRLQSSLKTVHLNIFKINLLAEVNYPDQQPYLLNSIPSTQGQLRLLSFELNSVSRITDHFLAVGIEERWQTFETTLAQLRIDAEEEQDGTTTSNQAALDQQSQDPDDRRSINFHMVRLLHADCLTDILQSLFLDDHSVEVLKIVDQLFELVHLLSRRTSEWKVIEGRQDPSWGATTSAEISEMRQNLRDLMINFVKSCSINHTSPMELFGINNNLNVPTKTASSSGSSGPVPSHVEQLLLLLRLDITEYHTYYPIVRL